MNQKLLHYVDPNIFKKEQLYWISTMRCLSLMQRNNPTRAVTIGETTFLLYDFSLNSGI